MSDQVTLPLPPVTDKNELPLSLRTIVSRLESARELSASMMRNVVLDAGVKVEDILPWADYDHPAEDSYGRRMIFKGPHFEIMAMSWRPGDFAAIHDHGYTQWGAVQMFGFAEHATFDVKDNRMYTSSRLVFQPGDVVGVNHDLIHQMGNKGTTPFMSLHVYGQAEVIESVTGDARVYDLLNNKILRVDGGVFFALPEQEVKRREDSPQADFPTRLRHLVELSLRLLNMESEGIASSRAQLEESLNALFAPQQAILLQDCLGKQRAIANKQSGKIYYNILKWEVAEAAKLQQQLKSGYEVSGYDFSRLLDLINQHNNFDSFLDAVL
jgi:cysteine dioxygenase